MTNAQVTILIGIMVGLVGFGILYDRLVNKLEKSGRDRGLTAFLVVGGTVITLAATIPLIGLMAALLVLACFAASGLPMVLGAWERYTTARKQDEEAASKMAKELLDGQEDSGRICISAGDQSSRERK